MTRWPRFSIYTTLAILISLFSTGFFLKLWVRNMPLVERYDMPAYFRVSIPPVPFWTTYTLVMHKGHWAIPEQEGTFYVQEIAETPEKLNTWLRTNVYHASIWWFLKIPLAFCGIFGFGMILLGRYLDRNYNAETRDGQNLRGPQLVSAAEFNKRIKFKDRYIYIQSK